MLQFLCSEREDGNKRKRHYSPVSTVFTVWTLTVLISQIKEKMSLNSNNNFSFKMQGKLYANDTALSLTITMLKLFKDYLLC